MFTLKPCFSFAFYSQSKTEQYIQLTGVCLFKFCEKISVRHSQFKYASQGPMTERGLQRLSDGWLVNVGGQLCLLCP